MKDQDSLWIISTLNWYYKFSKSIVISVFTLSYLLLHLQKCVAAPAARVHWYRSSTFTRVSGLIRGRYDGYSIIPGTAPGWGDEGLAGLTLTLWSEKLLETFMIYTFKNHTVDFL